MGMILGFIVALIVVGGGAYWEGEQHGSEMAMMHDQMMAEGSSSDMMASTSQSDMMGSSTDDMMSSSSDDMMATSSGDDMNGTTDNY